MSSVNQNLESRLRSLECHFTWDLHASTTRSKALHLRDKLDDIGAVEEGYYWLGHIYNLQGFLSYKLGLATDACRHFGRAAEAFRQIKNTVTDEGPWLAVNYGNMAWMLHYMGEEAGTREYLSKVDALLIEHPSPCEGELHPEICAEKAWTLTHFGGVKKQQQAASYFQRALRMQPDTVEWHTSLVLALVHASKSNHGHRRRSNSNTDEIFERMKIAKGHDPGNFYLAALYLEACAKRGEKIAEKARELARKVLVKPVSSYSGLKPLLRLYRDYLSMDEAIDLAEEVLERHPRERYLLRCAAICYKKRIFFRKDTNTPLEAGITDRAASLYREVIPLYPDSSLKRKITLAQIYAESNRLQEADGIFEELLSQGESEENLDEEGLQMVYNCYAKYVHSFRQESYKSIEFHMRAAGVPVNTTYRENSVRILKKIKERGRNRMCGQIAELLDNL